MSDLDSIRRLRELNDTARAANTPMAALGRFYADLEQRLLEEAHYLHVDLGPLTDYLRTCNRLAAFAHQVGNASLTRAWARAALEQALAEPERGRDEQNDEHNRGA